MAAISVDGPQVNQRQMSKMGYKFTFLSDEKTDVIRRYDLLHKGGGPKGSDISRPAEFLVDPLGKIVWMNLTESIGVRTRPDQVLRAFDESAGQAVP